MTKKSVKGALLTSSVALFVCFTMLIGTTFAWFTDSVTSANNIIKSGNLDVKFEYLGENGWADVSNAADILTNDLWEPGVTEVAYLKVSNAGSLALKYQLGINIVSETAGINVAGTEFKLSDYLYFGVVENQSTAFADRAAAVAAVTNPLNISAGYTKEAEMAAGDDRYFALVVYMPETVANEANHNGTNVPEINLGLNVFATQLNSEDDSFGPDYDKNATYNAQTPLAKTRSFGDNDVVTLTKDNGDEVTILGANRAIDTTGSLRGEDLGIINLDAAYQFEPNISAEELANSEYADWHADFVVYADKDVPANSILLAGYYDAWCSLNNDKWVAFSNDGLPVDANTELRLVLEALGATVSYEEICKHGNDGIGFLCGLKAYGANAAQLAGTTITVELRLYEATGASAGTETPNYITVGTYRYTF